MERLKNKTAVITGGAGGIGTATAKKFLDEAAKVILVDYKEEELKKAVEDLGSENVDFVVADVSLADDVKKYADRVKEKFGEVDIFFNNAGVGGEVKPVADYPIETFDKLMGVNVRGAWLGMKYMVPLMRKGGSIIITSSVAGLRGTANVSPYVTSKHALIGMMRSTALELASQNIRVNSVNPSPVDNRMMRSLEKGFSWDGAEEVKSQFEQMIPMNRYAENEDIADLVVFLASDESRFITGSVHCIDGGMNAK